MFRLGMESQATTSSAISTPETQFPRVQSMSRNPFWSACVLTLGIIIPTAGTPRMFAQEDAHDCLKYSMQTLDGESQDLAQYRGKVLLLVNVASECGLTPQYEGLQALHEKYADRGLVILGFPCNQFGGQEPGTADEIKQFCTANYGVTFPMFAKIEVNGDAAAPLYQQLTSLELEPAEKGPIRWNFEKFLVDRQGKVVARYAPTAKPNDPALIQRLEELLGASASSAGE